MGTATPSPCVYVSTNAPVKLSTRIAQTEHGYHSQQALFPSLDVPFKRLVFVRTFESICKGQTGLRQGRIRPVGSPLPQDVLQAGAQWQAR